MEAASCCNNVIPLGYGTPLVGKKQISCNHSPRSIKTTNSKPYYLFLFPFGPDAYAYRNGPRQHPVQNQVRMMRIMDTSRHPRKRNPLPVRLQIALVVERQTQSLVWADILLHAKQVPT